METDPFDRTKALDLLSRWSLLGDEGLKLLVSLFDLGLEVLERFLN